METENKNIYAQADTLKHMLMRVFILQKILSV